MTDYKAPVRDMRFVLHDVLGLEQHCAELGLEDTVSPDFVDVILDEFARFAEKELAPLRQVGDQQGCRIEGGKIITPAGFKEAFHQYTLAGWQSLSIPEAYGGQGLLPSLSNVLSEMKATANIAWEVFGIASYGAMKTLLAHGTEEQKETFLRKLVEGEWAGTMCLTEPHCGTDLGLLRTAAKPQSDGSYEITGTKIFISAGDHDFTENIVHIVLARIEGAPQGTQGISLFIVPKVNCDEQGNLLEPNALGCGSLEHKMGMHGNPTCVMNFDGAKGYLLGEANKGLMAMFTFMNTARIGAAIQGYSHAELGFQKSLAYAQERLQMRSLSGPKNPDGPADPIIVHPDVRRMLLTQKSFAEGLRLFNYFLAFQVDKIQLHPDPEQRQLAQSKLDLLTPIAKAFSTEVGLESATHAIQCFGGHGYIQEWGVEQNYRDARISTIWEGTTGVQANDLLGRKVLGPNRPDLEAFICEIEAFCQESKGNSAVLDSLTAQLKPLAGEWRDLTTEIAARVAADPEEMGAAAVNYLMYCGYACLAYCWAQAVAAAQEKLDQGTSETEFYQSKATLAQFYYDHLLTRTHSLVADIKAGAGSIMALDSEHFQFG